MFRIGVVQSTSSVDFFGIEIVGDCAIVAEFTAMVASGEVLLGMAWGVGESKLRDLSLTLIRRGWNKP